MAYEDYTLRQFEKAWFKKDYSEMSKEVFNEVYNEYVEAAGLFNSEDFELVCGIQFLNHRINFISMFIELQLKFMKEFKIAYSPIFELVKEKYGHVLIWRGKIKDFKEQLEKVKLREKKYITIVESKIQELDEKRERDKKLVKQDETPESKLKKTRESYIKTFVSLGKIGYKIDRDTTTVEDYASMIKQQFEEYKLMSNKSR